MPKDPYHSWFDDERLLIVETLARRLTNEDLDFICEDLGDYAIIFERLCQRLLKTN